MGEPDSIPLRFKWTVYHPDQREYRNQSIEIEPIEVYVQIDIPMDYYLVTPEKSPVLSVAGLRYVVDLFDTVFLPPKKQEPNADDDWEDDKSTEEKPASEKDDWDSDADFDTEKETDKVPWKDDGDDWS